MPATAGVEGAGIVEKLGPGTEGVARGDRVAYVHVGSGEHLLKMPESLSITHKNINIIPPLTHTSRWTPLISRHVIMISATYKHYIFNLL